MKKTLGILTILAILSVAAGPLAAQNSEDAKFKKFQDTFWDTYFRFFPTAGTHAGFPKYMEKLEDFSEGAVEKFHDGLDAANTELVTKIDKTKESPEIQIEHEMLMDFLDLEFVKFEMLLPWEYNPLYYNNVFLNSVRGLLVKENGAVDARVKGATDRAKLLPALIKKAKENLKTPAAIYTETAIRQLPAIIEFYRTDVPNLVASASGKGLLLAETAKVVAALEDYLKYLQNDLLVKSSGNFRVGDQADLRILRMTSQGNLSMEELVARSRADYNNIRRDMALVCIPFYKIMYPQIDIDQIKGTEDQIRTVIIKGVLDKIKVEHVAKEEFVNRISSAAASIKEFLVQNQLLELPAEDLKIEPMPAFAQGAVWTRLVAPGAFEAAGPYALQVMPVPAEWSDEQAQQFMEEHNNFYLDYMTAQNVFPGTFVPTAAGRKDASIIKRLAANQALIKGWPVFMQELLITSGYGEYDLRMRLNQLKLMLKTIIDFQLELNVHQGGMTKEQAVDYMTRGGFQTAAEAERKWNQVLLNPGEAALAYIGYQELLDMQKDYRKLKGDQFTVKEFLQKTLSFGAVPLRTLKVKLAQ
jgi:uncharacterized protein (DUF885 family)